MDFQIICLGHAPGELLPPQPSGREEECKRILTYARSGGAIFTASALDALYIDRFRRAALVGAWAESCIAAFAGDRTQRGMTTLIDTDYILFRNQPAASRKDALYESLQLHVNRSRSIPLDEAISQGYLILK